MKKLAGKLALITGGASGIGEATARRFGDHGARTIVIADIRDHLGRQVTTSIGATDCTCTYVHRDVSDEEQVKALVDSTVANYGKLDIMFSNAGILSNTRGVRGRIICTTSVAGSRGMKRRTDYCMSKHAVLGLVRSASKQLGGHGIRVNCMSPNAMATALTCAAHAKGAEEFDEIYESQRVLKEVALTTGHVADAVLFLASNESGLMTGHDLVVDGGYEP